MAMDRVAMDRGSIGDSLLYVLATRTWRPGERGGYEYVPARSSTFAAAVLSFDSRPHQSNRRFRIG